MPQRSATENEIIKFFMIALEQLDFTHLIERVNAYNRNDEAFIWRHSSGCGVKIVVSVFDDFRDPDISLLLKIAYIRRGEVKELNFRGLENCSLDRPFQDKDLEEVKMKLLSFSKQLAVARASEIQHVVEQYPQIA